MELLRITRQIHCKAVEQRATLTHRQYNRDWGTSYSRPPIDPYLTFPLLQNPGGATGAPCSLPDASDRHAMPCTVGDRSFATDLDGGVGLHSPKRETAKSSVGELHL